MGSLEEANDTSSQLHMVNEEGIQPNFDSKGWPMLRRDAAFTGSDGSSVHAPLEKAWEFKAGGDVGSSPSVAYGLVFFGSKDRNVYALDAKTGQTKWVFKTSKAVTSTPVVEDGIVYVASEDKNLYALNANTGEKIWEFTTGKEICATPAVGNNLVFFGCKDKQVYALDAKTGVKKWAFESGDKDYSSPTISKEKLLISSKGWITKNLYAINLKNGELIWKKDGIGTDPCPIIYGNTVLAREANDIKKRILKINLDSGEKLGYLFDLETRSAILSGGMIFAVLKKPPGEYPGTGGLFAFKLQWDSKGSSYIARGHILAFSGIIYSLGWAATEREKLGAPTPAGEFVFVTKTGKHVLYGISTSKFMKRWMFYVKEKIKSYPVVSDGMVFVVSDKGKIHAFREAEDSNAASVLQDFSGFTKKPTFTAELYFPAGVVWPKCCCLCCGPYDTTTYIEVVKERIAYRYDGVPYCMNCICKVDRSKGGQKIFFGEPPGVQNTSPTTFQFRNEKYWAMFMELNGLR